MQKPFHPFTCFWVCRERHLSWNSALFPPALLLSAALSLSSLWTRVFPHWHVGSESHIPGVSLQCPHASHRGMPCRGGTHGACGMTASTPAHGYAPAPARHRHPPGPSGWTPGHSPSLLDLLYHVKAGAVPPVMTTPSPPLGHAPSWALKPEHTGSS